MLLSNYSRFRGQALSYKRYGYSLTIGQVAGTSPSATTLEFSYSYIELVKYYTKPLRIYRSSIILAILVSTIADEYLFSIASNIVNE